MRRFFMQLAFRLWFLAVALPAIEKELGAQTPPPQTTFEHHIVVPDTSVKASPMLPIFSEYYQNAQYDQWWHAIARCEGLELPRDYVRVRFFQVNAAHFYDKDHPSLFWRNGLLMVHWAVAQTFPLEGAIFVALPFRDDWATVQHEMLHLLIYWNRIPEGKDLHPMPYYGRCGMTITYNGPK
jgi:hypothetical protein